MLPGTIQAENFDEGGASVAYFDTTPGNRGGAYRQTDVDIEATADAGGGWDIGWTRPGEWLQYTADVSRSGTYALELRVASASTGGTVRVEVDGADVTGTLVVPNTGGWQAWQTIRKDGIALQAGRHRIRLVFVGAGTNGHPRSEQRERSCAPAETIATVRLSRQCAPKTALAAPRAASAVVFERDRVVATSQ